MGRRSMEPLSVSNPASGRIAAALEASLDGKVWAAVEAIWEQVPAYRACQDDRLRDEVAGHVRAVFRAFLVWLAGGRPAQRADFTVTREQAARRVAQRISLADFLKAFRIAQLTLWQGVRDAVGDDAGAREAALSAVAQIMQVFELGSTVAAEAYAEAQQHALAEGDRVRRDLLEDLLARHAAVAGPKRALLRAGGLGPDTRLLVAAATPVGKRPGDRALRDAAVAVGRLRGGGQGLAVVRQDEVVGIAPLPRGGTEVAVASLRRACDDLQRRQIRLAVGVSTVHAGLLEVPQAYAEAQAAREGLGGAAGVLALPMLTSFDYLVLREDETARRLIRPEVRQFVADDAAAGGTLIATLVEYAACDLNARTAADRLHLHVNTAYYRLERIAERTGCDLRRLADVIELLIAVRLLAADPAPQP